MEEILITQLRGFEDAQPRKALVQSIQEQGFLPVFPIIVAPEKNKLYPILDGRRRTAAAVRLGLTAVPAVITPADASLTILAHATRSENPVAELKAYQELQRAGMSEAQIARAGYATLGRIRKISKLKQLIPSIAHRVESGEIAPGVAFKISALPADVQNELAQEEKITGPLVREYQYARRQTAKLSTPGLTQVFEPPTQANIDELFSALPEATLQSLLDSLPPDDRYITWRAKVKKYLTRHPIPVDLSVPNLIDSN